jgi:eukaryotic-like serine/threonine-protein kinase
MSEQNDRNATNKTATMPVSAWPAAFDESLEPLLGEPETDARGELPAGHIIAYKYWIEKVIGHGGMGVIHQAQHLRLGQRVAIKVMRPALMGIAGMTTRFLREARAASQVKSEHVCRVLDIDMLPSGMPYIVFEHLEGLDLAELLRTAGPLPIAEAARYLVEACDAIAETHRLGIVHRDLKPSNLFLATWCNGRRIIKVLDYGISKTYSADARESTRTGITLGSPQYMAPEQVQPGRHFSGRVDIWGLGAILYALLAGQPPFKAPTVEDVCRLVLLAEPPPLVLFRPELPQELAAIVERCLRKNPDERFATADDLARALLPFCKPNTAKLSLARVRRERPDKQDHRAELDQDTQPAWQDARRRATATTWTSETSPTSSERRSRIAGGW